MTGSPTLRLDAEVTECGDVVSGSVLGVADLDGGGGHSVILRRRAAGGDAPDDTAVVEAEISRSGDGRDGSSTGGDRFSIRVPHRGPISYEGPTLSVSWQVELVVDATVVTATPVTVLPTGGVALWARQAAGPPLAPS